LQTLAKITGSLSVVGSFCAGMHQFYLGYLYEGADGFSPILLLCWILGDICNVIGTFWTHQLTFQKVIACASTFNDVILVAQHNYYKRKHRRYAEHHINPEPMEVDGGRYLAMKWNSLLRPYILFTLVSASQAAPISLGESGDLDDDEIDFTFLIGQCMAWMAELSYAFALVPQVMENFSRKSTGSVSIIMFLSDAISSMNYLATIFITADEKSSHKKMVEFLLEELPYIFGTAACLFLDLVLLFQYFLYPQFIAEIPQIDTVATPHEIVSTTEPVDLQPFRSWKSVVSHESTDESRHPRI